jgi:hypothetical protein
MSAEQYKKVKIVVYRYQHRATSCIVEDLPLLLFAFGRITRLARGSNKCAVIVESEIDYSCLLHEGNRTVSIHSQTMYSWTYGIAVGLKIRSIDNNLAYLSIARSR